MPGLTLMCGIDPSLADVLDSKAFDIARDVSDIARRRLVPRCFALVMVLFLDGFCSSFQVVCMTRASGDGDGKIFWMKTLHMGMNLFFIWTVIVAESLNADRTERIIGRLQHIGVHGACFQQLWFQLLRPRTGMLQHPWRSFFLDLEGGARPLKPLALQSNLFF